MRETRATLLRHRVRAHGLAGPLVATPDEIVARFGAIQGEDYAFAKWSLALRAEALDDAATERAIADGRLVRTHLLRPTWHLVHRDDLRWIQRATGPRIAALGARRFEELGLTARLRARSNDAIARALAGGKHLTRAELGEALASASIEARGVRLAHLMFHAELAGLIASGAPRGAAQTYALVDERIASRAVPFEGEAALAELARRYFSSRGPATEKDFRWWATLPAADARRAIAAAAPSLEMIALDGRSYWRAPAASLPAAGRAPRLRLLPVLDESMIAYTDSRDLAFGVATKDLGAFGDRGLMHWIVQRGEVIGRWRVLGRGKDMRISVGWLKGVTRPSAAELARAIAACGRYFGLPATLAGTDAPTRSRRR